MSLLLHGPRYDFGAAFTLSAAPSMMALSRRVGIHQRQLYRYAREGLTHRAADRLAVRLGFVPYLIWPEWLRCEPSAEVVDWVAERDRRLAAYEADCASRRAEARATIDAADLRAKAARAPLAAVPCEGCDTEFVPKCKAQRFCRMNCAQAHRAARKVAC